MDVDDSGFTLDSRMKRKKKLSITFPLLLGSGAFARKYSIIVSDAERIITSVFLEGGEGRYFNICLFAIVLGVLLRFGLVWFGLV